MSPYHEKRILQCAVMLACLVPITAGSAGAIMGSALMHLNTTADMDNHFRYLSGLLLGIGLMFLSCVPHIERHGAAIKMLTFIVVAGGMARLWGFIAHPGIGWQMQAALAMELIVTPLLCLWQHRIQKRFISLQ